MVAKCDGSKERYWFSGERCPGITRIRDRTDVYWSVVHVVLYSLSINDLKFDDVVLVDFQIRAQINAPSPSVAREVKLIGTDVHPLNSP